MHASVVAFFERHLEIGVVALALDEGLVTALACFDRAR
jgi:hypothetical protein